MQLPLDIKLDPQTSSHVLSVVQNEYDYLFGITKRAHNYFQLSTEPKAFEEYSSTVSHPSIRCKAQEITEVYLKAVNKLDETIRHLKLTEDEIVSAIDLGASPGGWTRYLAQQAKIVYSIDAADLSAEVVALENVVHIKCVAEKAMDELKRLLLLPSLVVSTSEEAAEKESSKTCVDLLVSDMNVTPFTLLPYLESYASFLKPGGRLIATLKFIGTGNNREAQLMHLRNTLEAGPWWMSVQFLWCMANTKSERMLIATRRRVSHL